MHYLHFAPTPAPNAALQHHRQITPTFLIGRGTLAACSSCTLHHELHACTCSLSGCVPSYRRQCRHLVVILLRTPPHHLLVPPPRAASAGGDAAAGIAWEIGTRSSPREDDAPVVPPAPQEVRITHWYLCVCVRAARGRRTAGACVAAVVALLQPRGVRWRRRPRWHLLQPLSPLM